MAMPLTMSWRVHPVEPARRVLWVTNNTIWSCTDITLDVPDAMRGGFYNPGPMAVGESKPFWSPVPGSPEWDCTRMHVTYTTILGLTIEEPIWPSTMAAR
jgi:hypothetical protein